MMMENIVEKVALFLSYSDDKLAQLQKENQALRLDRERDEA